MKNTQIKYYKINWKIKLEKQIDDNWEDLQKDPNKYRKLVREYGEQCAEQVALNGYKEGLTQDEYTHEYNKQMNEVFDICNWMKKGGAVGRDKKYYFGFYKIDDRKEYLDN